MNLIIVQPFGHRVGHYSTETWRFADTLSEKKIGLFVVSFDGFIGKSNEEIRERGFNHISFTQDTGPLKKLLVLCLIHFLSLFNNNRFINRWVGIVETYFTLQIADNYCSDVDRDLIFCNDGELTGFLLYCAGTSNQKIIHGRLEYGRTLPSNSIGRKIKRNVENWLCKRAIKKNKIKFICHVEELNRSYENTGFSGECIHISPLGIKKSNKIVDKLEARKILKLPEDKTILLVFGVGHPGKNYETIVRATKNLNSNCCVVFAGNSLPVNDARLLSKKYNCEENIIIFDKYIPESKHSYYFYSADYLLMSYKKEFVLDSSVLLDAIRFNVPVIASDTAWIGKMVESNGLGKTFSTEDPSSLEKVIHETLQCGEDEKERIRKNMEKLTEENSWENKVNEHFEVFQEILGLA